MLGLWIVHASGTVYARRRCHRHAPRLSGRHPNTMPTFLCYNRMTARVVEHSLFHARDLEVCETAHGVYDIVVQSVRTRNPVSRIPWSIIVSLHLNYSVHYDNQGEVASCIREDLLDTRLDRHATMIRRGPPQPEHAARRS